MSRITIDTNSAEDRAQLIALRGVLEYARPRIRLYQRLKTPSKQKAWRDKDPIIRLLIKYSNRIAAGKNDD